VEARKKILIIKKKRRKNLRFNVLKRSIKIKIYFREFLLTKPKTFSFSIRSVSFGSTLLFLLNGDSRYISQRTDLQDSLLENNSI